MRNEEAKAVGKRIVELRSTKGWTQEDLASNAELNIKTVKSAERGRRAVQMRSLKKLASALAVPVESLTAPRPAGNEPELTQYPSLDYETPVAAPRPRLHPTPAISVLPIDGLGASSDGKRFCDDLQKNIENMLRRWKWFEVAPSAGNARHTISCHIVPGNEKISLFAIIDSGENTYFSKLQQDINITNDWHWQNTGRELVVSLFCWIKQTLQRCEEEFGQRVNWMSDDARQCVLWAYLSWTRKTYYDNKRARELARKAIRLDPHNSRAWAIYAHTLVDGMSIRWDAVTKFGTSELIRAVGNAQAIDREDTFSRLLEAYLLMQNESTTAALQILMNAMQEDETTSLPRNMAGLFCEFSGELKLAEQILEPLLTDGDTDIVRANGLQILGECKGLLCKYDEGINAALKSMSINSHAVPAIRTLAVNLASCGLEDAARIAWRESDKFSPRYSTDGFKAQPWQPSSHDALSKWISNAEKASAYDE